MRKHRIIITGIVQGVGFRPFIYNLAVQFSLKGWVGNIDSNVIIEVETDNTQLECFLETIRQKAPALSKIESINYQELPFEGFEDFTIRESVSDTKGNIFISPDVCTCDDCLKELKDSRDRRYMYPFINCTNCGPRFTIIKDIPYDRDKTTMSSFEMCNICRKEYITPSDRRYHAQPVACHNCGPSLKIANSNGQFIPFNDMTDNDCIKFITEIIREGKIAAIKGLGGYHLACDALSESAVDRLRTRKHRDDKPFALMVKNLDVASRYCEINEKEKQLLKSPASPIVLLKKKEGIELPASIAQLNRYLGVMLPYTPVHHILFEQEGFPEIMVMTSGNLSSEPIFYKDDEAVKGLVGITDAFMLNNREIYIRTDDSVTRVFNNIEYIIRRSRGYVPRPINIDVHRLLQIDRSIEIPSVLACGGELKNVFCLNKNNLFYLSHHIGDLENESTNNAFTGGVEHFKRLFDISPECIAYDMHPNYFSSQYALNLTVQDKIAVQHHKAHIASCMAENGLVGNVIGVSFDGTGYGEDGNIWGGEFFEGGYYDLKRKGYLEYVMMPGGDSAVKHPWRMAVSYLFSIKDDYSEEGRSESILGECMNLLKNIDPDSIDFIIKMLGKKLNCPQTSSMGRFFDAISALLGIKTDISYEGQAAIELEYYANESDPEPYDVEFCNTDDAIADNLAFSVRTTHIVKQIVNDIQAGHSKEHISSRFHSTVTEIVLKGCKLIKESSSLSTVVLSGGVFQNITLLKMCVNSLEKHGFNVYTHSEIPSNDGGIAVGQAMIALAEMVAGKRN